MSAPQQQAPNAYRPAQQPLPPPQQSQLVRDIAVILATGAAVYVIAEGLEALLGARLKIGKAAITAALGLTSRGTAPTPRAPMARHGLLPAHGGAAIPRAAAAADLYYRAAYVLNAATRIEQELSAGVPLKQAIAEEKPYYELHEAARRNRLDTAGRVGAAAELFGDLLGWYRDPLSNSEAECIAADGHNFSAAEGTVIGYPGAVHRHCRCLAGPPHEGAGKVNDAVRKLAFRPRAAAGYRLRKAG